MGIFASAYPERLRQIPDPPLLLYCSGDASVLGYHSASVVWARKCSIVGKKVASRLGRGLADLGCTVISGLVLSIDSAAHRGALAAKAGATVAVFGGGFDHLYPTQNKNLAESIVTSNGMLISEYLPGLQPRRHHFPERNRIISGPSELTVLVEAREKAEL